MADYTRIGYYWDSQALPSMFAHGAAMDSTYLYSAMCHQSGYGERAQIFRQARSNLDSNLKVTFSNGAGMGMQGLCIQGNYIYASIFNGLLTAQSMCVYRFNRSDLTYAGQKVRYYESGAGGNPCQGISSGVDANGDNVIFQVGTANGFAGTGSRMKLAKYYPDLTWDADRAVFQGSFNRMFMEIFCDTAANKELYLTGKSDGLTQSKGCILKLTQSMSGGKSTLSYKSEVNIRTPNGGGTEQNDTWLFTGMLDPSDSTKFWAAGFTPNGQSGSKRSSMMLVRCKKADANGNLEVEKVYRIAHSAFPIFKCKAMAISSDTIYLASMYVPHSLLGFDEEVNSDSKAYLVALNKSDMTVKWARSIERGGGGGQHGWWQVMFPSDSTAVLYGIGWGNAYGASDKWVSTAVKYDTTDLQNLPATLYDAKGRIKEIAEASYISVSDITSSCTITYPDNSADYGYTSTQPEVPDAGWGPTIATSSSGINKEVNYINNPNLILYLRPSSDASKGIGVERPSGSDHYAVMDDNPTDDATHVYRTAATWARDLYGFTDVSNDISNSNYVERIKALKFYARGTYTGTGGPYEYLKYSYRYSSGGGITDYPSTPFTVPNNSQWTDFDDLTVPFPGGGSWDGTEKWTQAAVNQFEAGVYIRSYGLTAETRMSEAYLKVEWEPFVRSEIIGNGGLTIGGAATMLFTLKPEITETVNATEATARRSVMRSTATDSVGASSDTGKVSKIPFAVSEALDSASTGVPGLLISRTLADSISIMSQATNRILYSLALSDTLSATDVDAVTRLITGSVTDSMTAQSVAAVIGKITGLATDSAAVISAIASIASMRLTVAEALALTGPVSGARLSLFTANDSADLASSAVSGFLAVDAITEGALLQSATSHIFRMGGIATDAAAINSSAASIAQMRPSGIDGLNVTELLIAIRSTRPVAADGMTITDISVGGSRALNDASDSMGISSAAGRTSLIRCASSDSFTTGDALAVTAIIAALSLDSMAITDGTNRPPLEDGTSDGLAITSSASGTLRMISSALSSIGIGDMPVSANIIATQVAAILELIGETGITAGIVAASISEGMAASETVSSALNAVALSLDGISITDALSSIGQFSIMVTDEMQAIDALAVICSFMAAVTDAAGISSSTEIRGILGRNMTIEFGLRTGGIVFTINKPQEE